MPWARNLYEAQGQLHDKTLCSWPHGLRRVQQVGQERPCPVKPCIRHYGRSTPRHCTPCKTLESPLYCISLLEGEGSSHSAETVQQARKGRGTASYRTPPLEGPWHHHSTILKELKETQRPACSYVLALPQGNYSRAKHRLLPRSAGWGRAVCNMAWRELRGDGVESSWDLKDTMAGGEYVLKAPSMVTQEPARGME